METNYNIRQRGMEGLYSFGRTNYALAESTYERTIETAKKMQSQSGEYIHK
jgi:hypothetical protein